MNATPWLPAGTVYGTLLNFRREFDLWAPRMSEAPYKAPPRAPVLYVKTANTYAPQGAAVPVATQVEIGATVGLVIGDMWTKQPAALQPSAQPAMNSVANNLPPIAGCVLLSDLSLPHDSYYRPALRYRNRDGFLVCGPAVRPLTHIAEVAGIALEVRINGTAVQTVSLADLVRDAATLLADVAEFQALEPGDVLMVGTDCLADGTRPRAKAGDRIEISATGFAALVHSLTQEAV